MTNCLKARRILWNHNKILTKVWNHHEITTKLEITTKSWQKLEIMSWNHDQIHKPQHTTHKHMTHKERNANVHCVSHLLLRSQAKWVWIHERIPWVRQQNMTNCRFNSAYSLTPEAIKAIFDDLNTLDIGNESRIWDPNIKFLFMTLNWWKEYRTEENMAGNWKMSESTRVTNAPYRCSGHCQASAVRLRIYSCFVPDRDHLSS